MGFFNKLFNKGKKNSDYEPPVTSAKGKIELEVPDDIFKEEYRKNPSGKPKAEHNSTAKAKAINSKSTKTKVTQAVNKTVGKSETQTKSRAERPSIKSKPVSEKVSASKISKSAKAKSVLPSTKNKTSAVPIKSETKSKTASKSAGGYFEIKATKDDRYVFNLYASNHLIVATSQAYSSVQSALTGIKSVMTNATAPIEDQTLKNVQTLPYPKWEIYLDSAKEYRFRLSASNGYCVCHSQGYNQKSSCKNGIKSIQKFAPTAIINKDYLKKN